MFQFSGFPSYDYFIHHMMTVVCTAGFPHSEICGSMDICSYPQLIAACHVLLRLLMPRHSPCALLSLTSLGSPFELNYMSFFPEIELIFFYPLRKNSFIFSALFSFQCTIRNFRCFGGLRWARTTDLTLIRRAL